MIHLKQPLTLSAQSGNVGSTPLFATAAATSSCQKIRRGARRRAAARRTIRCASTEQAVGVSTVTTERALTVTATVTAQAPIGVVYVSRGIDDLQDLLGKTLLLELVSSELDPSE